KRFMKHNFVLISIVFFSFAVITNIYAQEKPNVIVIMADDLGYADVGFNGSTEIPTPNIDRIAESGVTFTSGYTSYCVCGPSRAGFITGRYQQRFGFERNPLYRVNDPYMGLPHDEMTIAESVSQVGYKSGIIGKWHLGAHISNHPLNRGFDEFFGFLGGGHRYFPKELTIQSSYDAKNEDQSYRTWILRNHTPEKTDEYITDKFSNEAVAFINRHKDEPFFLFLSYNAPHAPMQAKPEDLALFPNLVDEPKHKRKTYAAMVHAVDRGVGKVLDKLQELNIEDNTIIFFLSDNGGPENKNASDNGILRGGKSDVYEGGYRVPFAMQWKKRITPGKVYNNPVLSLDIFATLSALSGSPTNPEKPLDGVNIIPYLTGEKEGKPHETIYIRKFDQDRHAVRYNDYKVIYFKDNTNKKLYNLSTNISEKDSENLYWDTSYIEKRNQLDSLKDDWEKDLIHPRFLGLVQEKLVWATNLNLSETNLEINPNDTKQVDATIIPLDAFNDVVEWSSNNTPAASVDQSGLITAHANGYAVITAKVVDRQQVNNRCVVKVGNPTPASAISLSKNTIDLLTGETTKLSATVSPEGDTEYAIDWSSSNPAVATVDEFGFVLTNKKGSAVITAKVVGSEHISAVCNISVNDYSETTQINDINVPDSDNIKVYPNPVTDKLNLECNGNVDTIQILNVNGQVIRKQECQNTIDVSMLRSGIYFLKSGEHVTKFIKE
ncbi:MAG: sulfatase-like hydrolase/transferase, partial [Prolixibacteraceae bacterium]|nr:sulfatase-like hydrolase/transferase [Prolixibacteraceae bacterium]